MTKDFFEELEMALLWIQGGWAGQCNLDFLDFDYSNALPHPCINDINE